MYKKKIQESKGNFIEKKNKKYQFLTNIIIMDKIKIKNKNNQSQPNLTFKTCDMDHEIGSQHKRQA